LAKKEGAAMKKCLLTLGFASVVSVVVIFGPALRVHSSSGSPVFSNNILKGSYAFHDAGSLNLTIDSDSVDEAFDEVGIESCDGNGSCSGSQTATFRFPFTGLFGFVCTFTFKSAYSVKSDGTGVTISRGTRTSGPCSSYQSTYAFVINNAAGSIVSYSLTSLEMPTHNINNVVSSGEFIRQ
jgi:hypothetical protein